MLFSPHAILKLHNSVFYMYLCWNLQNAVFFTHASFNLQILFSPFEATLLMMMHNVWIAVFWNSVHSIINFWFNIKPFTSTEHIQSLTMDGRVHCFNTMLKELYTIQSVCFEKLHNSLKFTLLFYLLTFMNLGNTNLCCLIYPQWNSPRVTIDRSYNLE